MNRVVFLQGASLVLAQKAGAGHWSLTDFGSGFEVLLELNPQKLQVKPLAMSPAVQHYHNIWTAAYAAYHPFTLLKPSPPLPPILGYPVTLLPDRIERYSMKVSIFPLKDSLNARSVD